MAKFFHLPRPKRYNYQYRYYDEAAEKRKEREERIDKELEAERSGKSLGIQKGEMEKYIKMTRRTQRKSNVRILAILVILLLIFYFFFYK